MREVRFPTRLAKSVCSKSNFPHVVLKSTIHVRKRDSRLVCLSTLASLGCKHHTRRKSTFPHLYRNVLFPHTAPKVLHSHPAQKQECDIFGLGLRKNSIYAPWEENWPAHVSRVYYPRLRLGWQFTRAVGCQSYFLSRCVIYYLILFMTRSRKNLLVRCPLKVVETFYLNLPLQLIFFLSSYNLKIYQQNIE